MESDSSTYVITAKGTSSTACKMSKMSKIQAVVTVLLAACCVSLPVSFLRTPPVMYVAIQNNYNATAMEASTVNSFLFGSYHFFGPGTTVMLNCFGFTSTICIGSVMLFAGLVLSTCVTSDKVLYFTCGILPGMGISMVYSAVYVFIGKIFDRRRPFVNNVLIASTAAVVTPYILQHWIEKYGFKSALFYTAVFQVISLPAGIVLTIIMPRLYPDIIRQRLSLQENKKIFATELLKKKAFIFYLLSCGFATAVKVLYGMYSLPLAISNGQEAMGMLTVYVIASVLTTGLRPVSGYLFSKKTLFGCAVNRVTILSFFGALRSFACFLLGYFAINYATFTITFIFVKFTSGCIGALPVTIAADLFGKDKLSSSLGFQLFVNGIFAVVTPILTGCLLDNVAAGNYSPSDLYRIPIYMGCGCSAIFSLLLVAVGHYNKDLDSTSEEGIDEAPMECIDEKDRANNEIMI